MNLKAIIVDDEKMARVLLEGMLREYCPEVSILEACVDLPTGVKAIRKHKPDLVFLDIEMPGHSGLELLDFFDEQEVNFSIIFTTAYNQYAIQAFKLAAVDYLLKPIESDELIQAVERFKKNQQQKDYSILRQNLVPGNPKKIAIPTVNSIKFIETDKITHLKADGAYTHIHLKDHTKLTTSKSLKTLEHMLSGFNHFFRCHKSFIVNIHFVNEYVKSDGGSLIVNEKEEVQLSSEKSAELLELMGRM